MYVYEQQAIYTYMYRLYTQDGLVKFYYKLRT